MYSLPDVRKELGCKVFQGAADCPRAKIQFEVIALRLLIFGIWHGVWSLEGIAGITELD